MAHVLVVDDDPGTQTLYQAMLRVCKLDCTISADGDQALMDLRRNQYDAVILDLLLPKTNGFEVLRELKCTTPKMLERVIVCTAVNPASLSDCTELPLVNRILYKPMELRELARAVLEVVRAGNPGLVVDPVSAAEVFAPRA